MNKTYIECSCSSFHCLVRLSYFPEDKDMVFLETTPICRGFLQRIWYSIKYILGFQVINSEAVLTSETIKTLRNFCDKFLDYDMVPVGNRDIFNWMLKYDKEYKGNPREVLYALIAAGAEHLYMEGLKNAEPLPQEVVDFVNEASDKALKEIK